MQNDYFGQSATVDTQHTATHLIIDHPMFPPGSSNVSKKSVGQYENLLSTLSAESPGLADLNLDTELGHCNPASEEKLDVIVALQPREVFYGLPFMK